MLERGGSHDANEVHRDKRLKVFCLRTARQHFAEIDEPTPISPNFLFLESLFEKLSFTHDLLINVTEARGKNVCDHYRLFSSWRFFLQQGASFSMRADYIVHLGSKRKL